MPLPPFPADAPVPGAAPAIQVRVDLVTGWLELTGSLDRNSAHLVHDAVSALLQTDLPRWTVDVTDVTLPDAAGLPALVSAHDRARMHGRSMRLYGAPPELRQALSGLDVDAASSAGNDRTATA